MWDEELHDEVIDEDTEPSDDDLGEELSMDAADFDDEMDVEPNTEDLE